MDEPSAESRLARFWRSSRTRFALVCLAGLYAAAIYAPLIANDRPLYMEAVHVREFGAALRSLVTAAQALERLAAESPRSLAADQEARGVAQRLATISSSLSEADRRAIEPLDRELERVRAGAGAAELRELAQRAQAALGDAQLQSRVSYPLIDALRPIEVFFMVFGVALAGATLWRRAVRGFARAVIVSFAVAGAAGLLWHARGAHAPPFASSSFKADIASGALVVKSVVFPPIAMGFAETNLSESYRAPTWSDAARRRAKPREHATPSLDAPAEPLAIDVRFAEPPADSALRHPLGTDSVGRDLLVRILWGGRVSLVVGLVSALLLTVIGTLAGAVAGYCGGLTDLVVSRVIEIVLCFPAFFLILIAVAFTDPSIVPPLVAIAVVIALVGWTGVARLVRGEFLRLREQEYVLAAKALGYSHARIVFAHMLPNAMGPVLVAGAFAIASGVLVESALSFLGYGIAHPIPSWGALASESHSAEHWWLQVFPGLLIFVTVVAYNLLAESLRDALDPRLSEEAR